MKNMPAKLAEYKKVQSLRASASADCSCVQNWKGQRHNPDNKDLVTILMRGGIERKKRTGIAQGGSKTGSAKK